MVVRALVRTAVVWGEDPSLPLTLPSDPLDIVALVLPAIVVVSATVVNAAVVVVGGGVWRLRLRLRRERRWVRRGSTAVVTRVSE